MSAEGCLVEQEGPDEADGKDATAWLEQMRGYARAGHAYDLEENEDQVRCVAAPVRDATGKSVAAISVSSAAQYMDEARMAALTTTVQDAAAAISRDMGWTGEAAR